MARNVGERHDYALRRRENVRVALGEHVGAGSRSPDERRDQGGEGRQGFVYGVYRVAEDLGSEDVLALCGGKGGGFMRSCPR